MSNVCLLNDAHNTTRLEVFFGSLEKYDSHDLNFSSIDQYEIN